MITVRATMLFVLVGWLLFYAAADWDIDAWVKGFYFWDKTKDCLLIMCVSILCPKIRRSINVVLAYSFIRLANEIGWLCGWWDKNDYPALGIMQLAFGALFFYYSYREMK